MRVSRTVVAADCRRPECRPHRKHCQCNVISQHDGRYITHCVFAAGSKSSNRDCSANVRIKAVINDLCHAKDPKRKLREGCMRKSRYSHVEQTQIKLAEETVVLSDVPHGGNNMQPGKYKNQSAKQIQSRQRDVAESRAKKL